MAFWANDPGTLPRMPGARRDARGDDLNVYLDWSPGEDADGDGPQAKAPKARRLFLGQLPDDQPDDAWADDPPDSERFEPDASVETELVEPVEIPAGESEQSWAPVVDEPIGDATAPVPPVATAAVPRIGGREARRAARNQRARLRRARIAVVVGVIATLVAGTAVYVGTRANGGDQRRVVRRRRPSSGSSSPTTATTVGASDAAPATEPAPVSDPAPDRRLPLRAPGAPRGTSPSQTGATGAGGGAGCYLPAGAGLDGSASEQRLSAQRATAKPDVSAAPGRVPLARAECCSADDLRLEVTVAARALGAVHEGVGFDEELVDALAAGCAT